MRKVKRKEGEQSYQTVRKVSKMVVRESPRLLWASGDERTPTEPQQLNKGEKPLFIVLFF